MGSSVWNPAPHTPIVIPATAGIHSEAVEVRKNGSRPSPG
jgi:hypothetical protein